MLDAESIIKFWFKEIDSKSWFQSSSEFDQLIKSRFSEILKHASEGKTESWRATALGRLAEILVLDQFSRNIHRGTPGAFAQDPLALKLAQDAVRAKADQGMTATEKAFLYMPYMHSEDVKVHEEALKLYDQPGLEFNLKYEKAHKDIIDRFGRYPHRNKILGRASTEEEEAFLKTPGSSF